MSNPFYDPYLHRAVVHAIESYDHMLAFTAVENQNGVLVEWETNSGYHQYQMPWQYGKEEFNELLDKIYQTSKKPPLQK